MRSRVGQVCRGHGQAGSEDGDYVGRGRPTAVVMTEIESRSSIGRLA